MAGSLLGLPATIIGLPITAPLGLVAGVGLGRRAMREERQRQLLARRQQAKVALRQYMDEATSLVTKACRDALRQAQRDLRNEFTARATTLQRSSAAALGAAERAASMTPDERQRRAGELEAQVLPIGAVADRAARLSRRSLPA
jgi:hypothetical protein